MSSDPRQPDLRRGRRRPEWDEYFMLIAVATRERAECIGRHVGAVLVREGRIVATGYNGTPRGFLRCNAEEQGCHRCAHRDQYPSGSAYDVCICVHAEQNAVLQAARLGYSLDGGHCYTTLRPLLRLPQGAAPGGDRAHRLPQPVGRRATRSSAVPTRSCSGNLRALGVVIEQLDLDPAVLQLGAAGAARRGERRAVRRPPPIAALFAVLAAGLAVIAVGAWGGGAHVAAVAAAVLAAWMAGLVVRLVVPPRKPSEDDPRIR